MLEESFGVADIPETAEPYQKEYFFKYLVQGQYLGLTGDELYGYAFRKVVDHDAKFPWFTRPTEVVSETGAVVAPKATKTAKASGTKKVRKAGVDGTAVFLEHRQKWVGYAEGRIVTTQLTEAKVLEVLKAKWNLG
jgi:hypothetical protein